MGMSTIIILGLIVTAFVMFAAALMYGDYATRQALRERARKAAEAEANPSCPAVQRREAA